MAGAKGKATNQAKPEAEIELKLLTDRRTARRIWSHPEIKSLISAPARTRHIKTTYYDTQKFDLMGHECALRVRTIGNQFEQHLKTAGESKGGVFHRKEWQTSLSDPKPSFTAWKGRHFSFLKPYTNKLQPIFESDMERTDALLVCEEFSIEVAVDIGVIRSFDDQGAPDKETPLTEIELELKAGPPHHIHNLAAKLAETLPLRLGWLSKAQRGYTLCLEQSPPSERANKIKYPKGQLHTHSISHFLADGMRQYLANAANIDVQADIEAIHQARVACRRIRAGLDLARPYVSNDELIELRSGIRNLAAILSPIRDIDVLVTETLPPILENNETPDTIKASLNAILEACQKRRGTLVRTVQRQMRLVENTQLLLKLAQLIDALAATSDDQNIDDSAVKLLIKRFKPLRKSHEILLSRDPIDCHNLRIAAKKLRYTAEFYAALRGNKALKKLTQKLTNMQQTLGRINDTANTPALMREIAPKTHDNLIAIGYVSGWYTHKTLNDIDDAIEISSDINEASLHKAISSAAKL